uniref:Uncharacterized protein n=2 Tax=Oryza glaberrima TaxID=4538 RepID=I1PW15_ORYGL
MAPPRLLFDLNEPPPEEDIEDDVAMACEDSQPQPQPHLDADDGGEGDGSTACDLPSPPPPPPPLPPKDDSTGGESSEISEPLLPVLDLDAPLSPLDDDDDDEVEDDDHDLPRPPDDPDGARSPGPSHSERMAKTDRSTTASHAEAASTVTTPCSHAADDGGHGVTTSPRTTTTSLPDSRGMKTLSPAFSARSSSETGAAARVHGSHMPRRDKPPAPSVPRDDDYGGSRLAGSPSTSHHERSMRSHHPYAMRSGGTPRNNNNNNRRRPRRPMRQGYKYNGHDQRGQQQVNNYSHGQRQVYGNGQDQRQQLNNNGRDQRHQVYSSNCHDQRQPVYNNDQDQRQQVYNNGQDQRRQGHHGYRKPESYQGGQGQLQYGYSAPNRQRQQQQQQQGYSSGRPSAGGQYAGEDSYGSRQIPANQQHQHFRGQQRHVVKPYYARGFDASDDRATNAGKQAKYDHPEQQQRAYQQHRRNTQSTAGGGGPARRRQYYGDLYN